MPSGRIITKPTTTLDNYPFQPNKICNNLCLIIIKIIPIINIIDK